MNNQEKVEAKHLFRQEARKVLAKEASSPRRYRKDKEVIKRLYTLIQASDAKEIFCYLPLDMEVNLTSLLKRLRQEKRTLYVPFMEGKSFRLVKYRFPLVKKRFGLREPKDSKQYRKKKIDLAIVPIIGMDTTCRRIGFGKGMYDRFFEKELKNISYVVFVARRLCYTSQEITDRYDVRADEVIVP